MDVSLIEKKEKVYSVSGFTRIVKDLLESEIGLCWIKGEISNLRVQVSGHIYFTLKDEGSQVSAVLFRSDALRQNLQLKDGLQVLICGGVSVFEPRGHYQIIAKVVLEEGVGRLQVEFERLKQKLAGEGLFDSSRKRAIPVLPQSIAIVTSPTGAVLRDFVSILRRRHWRGDLIIFPAKVQGEGAVEEMIEQLNLIKIISERKSVCAEHRLPEFQSVDFQGNMNSNRYVMPLNKVDLVVIGRGGGSIEDLWCFNDERLVRAIAACPIPIISAVGHEVDFTLSDFVADRRAETPSAAAELISSNHLDLLNHYYGLKEKFERNIVLQFKEWSDAYAFLKKQFEKIALKKRLEYSQLKLDDVLRRWQQRIEDGTRARKEVLRGYSLRLNELSPFTKLSLIRERLSHFEKRLENVSIHKTLNRGYVMVKNGSNQVIKGAKGIQEGECLRAYFADGIVELEVKKVWSLNKLIQKVE